MGLFAKKAPAPLLPPAGCTAADIALQSSICTGESLIGFRRKGGGELLDAALVRSEREISAYYARYGFAPPAALPPLPKRG